jgi:quercetin dioxygenase-like cupin family protein
MSIERAADHPVFELGGNTVTSLAAPARGATEAALFRIEVPAGGGLPRHHHDHLDVFTIERGTAVVVTMLGGTKLIRDDGTITVPPWVS